MSYLTENDKRSFAYKIIKILEENAPTLAGAGYDATAKITELTNQAHDADKAEALQEVAEINYKAAIKTANESLKTYYNNASAAVELVAGLLGKNHPLVLELRDLRKVHRESPDKEKEV